MVEAPARDTETSAVFSTFDGGQTWTESGRIIGHDAREFVELDVNQLDHTMDVNL